MTVNKLISLTLSAVFLLFIALQTTASADGNLNYARKLMKDGKFQKAICEYEAIIYSSASYDRNMGMPTGRLWRLDENRYRRLAMFDFVTIVATLENPSIKPSDATEKPLLKALRTDAKLMSAIPEVYRAWLPIAVNKSSLSDDEIEIFLKESKKIPRLCQIPKEVKTEEYSD